MKKLKTNDGSYTFLDSNVGEVYNPLTGAVNRAFDVYVNQIDFSKYKRIKILDIGFGLGYNGLCLINKCLNNSINVEIIAVEKNSKILDQIKNLAVDDALKESFSILVKGVKLKKFKFDNISFNLFVEDALGFVSRTNYKFDVILLDPFSYSKNKELYEKEFLLRLKSLFNDNGILICYNSNPVFINSLLESGLYAKKYKFSEYEYGIIASPFIEFKLEDKDKKLVQAFGILSFV